MTAVPGVRTDPLGAWNFVVTLIDSTNALTAGVSAIGSQMLLGFSECSGLDANVQLEEHHEGGNNGAALKVPTRVSYGNIRLRRGVALSDDLWNWTASFARGRGRRRDGTIALQNDLRITVRMWAFTGALPVKWTGPALDAAQNRLAIEELELAPQRLQSGTLSALLAESTGVSV